MADGDWYAVVDAAQDPTLRGLIMQGSSWACLFAGNLPPVLAATAPHLVKLIPGEPLFEAWKTRGQGQNWGIMCRSARPIEVLRRHFRQFLQVRMPDGMVVLFRFYDPRVFNTYIRAATPEEQMPWFEGIGVYTVEDKDGAHGYAWQDGQLLDNGKPVRMAA